jgi:beta-galactosidase
MNMTTTLLSCMGRIRSKALQKLSSRGKQTSSILYLPSSILACAWATCCVLAFSVAGAIPAQAARATVPLDGAWSFRLDPNRAGERERWFDSDARFTNVIQVPGAWQAQGYGVESDKLRHHYEGRGWYQREVRPPRLGEGQRLFLCVGGVHRSAKVWFNGRPLGEHVGYLSPFEFDLTPLIQTEASATLALCVDGRQNWDVDCLTGCFDLIDEMFTPWGGIWGHVWLETRPAVWLEDVFVRPRVAPPGCTVTAALAGQKERADAVELEVLNSEGGRVGLAGGSLTEPDASRLEINLVLPGAREWSPEKPILHTACLRLLKGQAEVDRREVRFGLREIQVRGSDFYLNGRKLYLRGYGDDAIYPKSMAAPSEKGIYRERLQAARDRGFNYVRHHSHILPPEYYEAADEIGLLVSAEFPIAYEQYYQKAKGPALELYQREWAAAIRRLRNHPSIFDWCMGNEMWESFPLAPALYRVAKELDPTRPVIDSDGLWPAGFLDGAKDRPTLDFYPVLFDEWSLPLDNPGKHRFPGAPRKPVLSHETGNYATVPRLDLIEEFRDNFKPFWLTPFRDKLDKLGLRGEAEQWSQNSERLYLLAHKLNLEDIRKNPRISGYMWWLLQDYWTGANGLFDTYFRPKPIPAALVRQFNAATVLLQDGLPATSRGGQPVRVRLLLSNYAPEPVRDGRLKWTAKLGGRLLTQKEDQVTVGQGEVAEIVPIQFELPEVTQSESLLLEASLDAGTITCRNEWSAWIYPSRLETPRLAVPLYAGHDLAPALAAFGAKPLPEDPSWPARAVFVVSQPTVRLIEAAEAGACLVCLSPHGVFPSVPNRFKPAWWLGGESDCNAGTVVYDHPATRLMAPDGWCDAGWSRLLEGAQAYVLDQFPARPQVIVRGLDVHTVCRSQALLFEAAVGSGSIIVSGLNLDAGPGATPEAEWLLARLLEHAAAGPRPKAVLPTAFLRQQIGKAPAPEGPFFEGFARTLTVTNERNPYPSFRESEAPLSVCRQLEIGRSLEWETAVIPADWRGPRATFVFAGGLGWRSQPKTAGFSLQLNGREALRFDVTRDYRVWSGQDGAVKLWFVPKKLLPEDALGLFYLSVDPGLLQPGKPCRIGVRSEGQGSRRWFGLNAYSDLVAPPIGRLRR